MADIFHCPECEHRLIDCGDVFYCPACQAHIPPARMALDIWDVVRELAALL